jgi:hypothetical protein
MNYRYVFIWSQVYDPVKTVLNNVVNIDLLKSTVELYFNEFQSEN